MFKPTRVSPYFRTLVIGALALLVAPACKRKEAATGASAPTGAPSGAPTAKPATQSGSADQAEGAKLNAAIECLNRHSNRVAEARGSYLKDVDPATGSSHGKKVNLLGLYGIAPCVRDIKEAGALKPAVPALDAASADYVAALEGLEKAWQEIGAYYQKGDYLDDQGKKAALLHPKVMDAFKTFGAANQKLSTTVGAMNRARRVAKLAAREKAEGRNLSVILDSMMIEAETLIDQAMSQETTADTLDPQIASVGKLIDEVDAYADAHKDEASQWGSLSNIKSYDKAFLAATKVVARKLRAKAQPTRDELQEIGKQYNSLVDNYNR